MCPEASTDSDAEDLDCPSPRNRDTSKPKVPKTQLGASSHCIHTVCGEDAGSPVTRAWFARRLAVRSSVLNLHVRPANTKHATAQQWPCASQHLVDHVNHLVQGKGNAPHALMPKTLKQSQRASQLVSREHDWPLLRGNPRKTNYPVAVKIDCRKSLLQTSDIEKEAPNQRSQTISGDHAKAGIQIGFPEGCSHAQAKGNACNSRCFGLSVTVNHV